MNNSNSNGSKTRISCLVCKTLEFEQQKKKKCRFFMQKKKKIIFQGFRVHITTYTHTRINVLTYKYILCIPYTPYKMFAHIERLLSKYNIIIVIIIISTILLLRASKCPGTRTFADAVVAVGSCDLAHIFLKLDELQLLSYNIYLILS